MDRSFDGNMQISGTVTVGGDTTVRGSVTLSRDLRVHGWLYAWNIATVYQGAYSSETALQTARPAPAAGWTATVVNTDGSCDAYMVVNGAWAKRGTATGLEETVPLLALSVEDLSSDLSDAVTALESLTARVVTAESTLQGHLTTWESVKENLTEYIYPTVEDNKKKVAAQAAAVESLQGSVSELRGTVNTVNTTLQGHLTTWEAVKDHLVDYIYPTVEDNKKKVAAQATTIASVQSSLASLQTAVASLQTSLSALQGSVSTLQGQHTALTATVEAMDQVQEHLDERITDTGSDVSALSGKIAALQTSLSQTDGSLQNLEGDVRELGIDVVDLKAYKAKLPARPEYVEAIMPFDGMVATATEAEGKAAGTTWYSTAGRMFVDGATGEESQVDYNGGHIAREDVIFRLRGTGRLYRYEDPEGLKEY